MRNQPEKQTQREIRRALIGLGFEVNDLTQPRRTMMPPGLPDLYARHPRFGRFWIEVKSARGYLSNHQRAWHAAERECGGTVLVCWSVDDLLDGLRGAGVPLTANVRSA